MYIKKLTYENVGPIEQMNIIPSFTPDGNPKPILLVGENGSGKSTVLSNIVDSFYEIAGKAYSNARQSDDGTGYQYFKAILPSDIHIGQQSMFSCVQFLDKDTDITYLCKSGDISREYIQNSTKCQQLGSLSWGNSENYKGITVDKKTAESIFKANVICYFGPDRYEKPAWLGDKYYETNDSMHVSICQRWNGMLTNDITVRNVTTTNLQWLLDVIADSRSDIENNGGNSLALAHVNIQHLLLLGAARKNLETIMSYILGTPVYFSLNFRNLGGSRFKILREQDNSVVASSLDALSTGQIALFNTFASIIRYADHNDINQSIYLDRITGIVVIDEIELHLHSKLQKEVLPKLIHLFPKVQFIITTHAPLFLLGMAETFSEDNMDVYELPKASKITVERFSEFQKAYAYLQTTQQYQEDLTAAVTQAGNEKKVLVITEGSTDWKHMKAAYQKLSSLPQYSSLFDNLEFDFLEYEPKNSTEPATYKLDMGNKALVSLCENYSKLPQTTKFIFIADRDDSGTNKVLANPSGDFKDWGNNVYSFILPLPLNRKETPNICIEHLYTDNEIKTEYSNFQDKIPRRLYIGNEFDEFGHSDDGCTFCQKPKICGATSIAIIEGSSGEKVMRCGDKTHINLALSKSKFASLILANEPPFDNFNFENFIPIFETIKKIITTEGT